MDKEKQENTNEKKTTHQQELEFLEKHDIETDLEEADLELKNTYQSFD